MIALAKRNLKIFFRDRASVFFSLLGVFIIIGLYVLFLGDVVVSDMSDIPNARFLMDSWIMAGLLAVTATTTTLGAFGVMVEDRSKKILKDFSSSPLRRSSLAGGYILSSYIVGIIMTVVAFIIGEVYIVASGGTLLPLIAIIKILGCIILSVAASSAMVFFIVSFFKSQNAFATASTIIGTLIGFLTGIYIPIGSLPEPVQFVMKLFPISHAGSLFRQIMMDAPLGEAFAGAPAEIVSTFNKDLGIVYYFGEQQVSVAANILILVATTVVFYSLATINISRKRK